MMPIFSNLISFINTNKIWAIVILVALATIGYLIYTWWYAPKASPKLKSKKIVEFEEEEPPEEEPLEEEEEPDLDEIADESSSAQ